MIWQLNNIIKSLSLLLFLLFISCAESDEIKSNIKQKSYSIFLREFKNQDEVEKYRLSLNSILWDKLRIEKIYDRNYKLFYGKYPSSFEAGQAAFDFYSNSLIKKYTITRNGKPTLDEYANILFVARYLDKPSVFNFNLLTNQTEVIWSEYGKKVVSLNSSADHNSIFVTTANRYGIHSGLRYIYDARVFLMKREEEQIGEAVNIGSGVQLYTFWENKDTFKVNLTFVDSVDSRVVVQKVFPFDLKGIPGEVKKRSFDLIRDGFPAPPKRFPIEISPNKRFRFREVTSQGESYIYLRDFNEKSEQLTVSTKRGIKDGRWSNDGNYLYIITEPDTVGPMKPKTEPSGELYVIDAVKKKLIRIFTGFRYENILGHGKLLFFDERSSKISQIKIYDCKHDKVLHTISMYGGCGLNNLPI